MSRSSGMIFRPGDEVVIVEPIIVKRVGYPLGINSGIEYITKNHKN